MPKQIHDAPSGPKPLGPYSVVTEAQGLVFVSGMIGLVECDLHRFGAGRGDLPIANGFGLRHCQHQHRDLRR